MGISRERNCSGSYSTFSRPSDIAMSVRLRAASRIFDSNSPCSPVEIPDSETNPPFGDETYRMAVKRAISALIDRDYRDSYNFKRFQAVGKPLSVY